LYNQTKDYLQEIAPSKQSIVKFYQSNDTPIFEKYNIERQIKTSFGKTVSMSKGAYLIIEHTEALHVIDVNSGNRSNKASGQNDHVMNTKSYDFKEEMNDDKAKHKILPLVNLD
jgi:ribonuclease G